MRVINRLSLVAAVWLGLVSVAAGQPVVVPGVNFQLNVDGTAARPSRTYLLDRDLGRYRIGADNEGFTAAGVLRWDYNTTRLRLAIDLNFSTDNTNDIGAAAANRPRSVYAGTSFLAGDGTEAAPAYSNDGDTNVGIRFSAADVMDFVTAGADRFQINASGHLLAVDDNTYDIGASGATRPRAVYVAGDVTIGDQLIVSAATNNNVIGGAVSATDFLRVTGTYGAGAGQVRGLVYDGTLTANAAQNSYGVLVSPTLNEAGSGVHSLFASLYVNTPGIGAGVADVTSAVSLYIAGAPTAGTTNNHALWVDAGTSRIDDDLFFNSTSHKLDFGTATPEAAITASVGSLFMRTDGGAGTTLYVKQSGTGNTGWQAMNGAGPTISGTPADNQIAVWASATALDGASTFLFDGTNATFPGGGDIRPSANSTSALNIANAAGTDYVKFDTTNSRVAIGGSNPTSSLQIETTTEAAFRAGHFGNDAAPVAFVFSKSRGATVGSDGLVQNNDGVGDLAFYANNGGGYNTVASVVTQIDGVAGAGDMPGRLMFFTVADGTVNLQERLRITSLGHTVVANAAAGMLLVGTLSNSTMTQGVTIDQDANDNQALAVASSSDIAHALTTGALAPAGTGDYMTVDKLSATLGGVLIQSLAEDPIAAQRAARWAAFGGQAATTPSTTAEALWNASAAEHDGANALVNCPANSLIFSVERRVAAAWNNAFMVDCEGDLHVDGSTTLAAFDAWFDPGLARTFDRVLSPAGVIESEWDRFVTYERADLVRAGILSDSTDGGRSMWSLTQHIKMLNGLGWQLHVRVSETERDMENLRAALRAVRAELSQLKGPLYAMELDRARIAGLVAGVDAPVHLSR